jgi:hypothetical protein
MFILLIISVTIIITFFRPVEIFYYSLSCLIELIFCNDSRLYNIVDSFEILIGMARPKDTHVSCIANTKTTIKDKPANILPIVIAKNGPFC